MEKHLKNEQTNKTDKKQQSSDKDKQLFDVSICSTYFEVLSLSMYLFSLICIEWDNMF